MKKTKKNITTLLMCSILSAGLLSSCQATVESSNKIFFWHTFGQTVQDELNKQIKSFEKLVKENEGVDVDIELSYIGTYDEILQQIKRGFATGNTPTVAVAYPDHVSEYLGLEDFDEQYVYDLENLFHDEKIGYGKNSYLGDDKDETDFVESFFAESTNYLKKGAYSLPFMKSTEILMYNKDIVEGLLLPDYAEAKGLAIPDYKTFLSEMTWDRFIDILKFVKADMDGAHKYGNNLISPLIYDSDENLLISKMYQNNIPFLSVKDGKGSVDFNNEVARKLVERLKSYYDDGLLLTKGTNGGKYGSDNFTRGETLFTVGSSGGAGYNDPGKASFSVDVVKVPYENNNPLYVSQGPTLTLLKSNGVSDEVNEFRKEYGWKFLKYITNTVNNVDAAYLGSEGYVPVRESSYQVDYYQEYLLNEDDDFLPKTANCVINEIQGRYLTTPVFKGSSAARDNVGGIVTQVLIGNKTIDKAFNDAESATKLAMGGK